MILLCIGVCCLLDYERQSYRVWGQNKITKSTLQAIFFRSLINIMIFPNYLLQKQLILEWPWGPWVPFGNSQSYFTPEWEENDVKPRMRFTVFVQKPGINKQGYIWNTFPHVTLSTLFLKITAIVFFINWHRQTRKKPWAQSAKGKAL